MATLSFNIDPVLAGTARLTDAQALEVYHNASLQDLGEWAGIVSARMHPEDHRTYVIDRNINYTNVCTAKCTFCGFRRDHEDADSYTLSYEKIGEKIRELVAIGGTQILMQGGMNDRLPLEWYEDLLRYITTSFPTVHIHAFSPPEIVEFERFFSLDARDVIRRLKAAGLKTIPGGGGEIFNPRVRRRIGIGKCTGDDWLRIMRVAHEEGLDTSATMLIGHIETVQERIEHMSAIRMMQDYALALGMPNAECRMPNEERTAAEVIANGTRAKHPGVFSKSDFHSAFGARHSALTGAARAFIHWPFQRENVPLGRAKEYDPTIHGDFDSLSNDDVARGRVVRSAGATEYLKMLALSRLFFDNIANLQSSWVTMGPKIGQLALFFGANDMGGAMMEENVVSAAGTTYKLQVRELCRLIRRRRLGAGPARSVLQRVEALGRPRQPRLPARPRTPRPATSARSTTRRGSAPRRAWADRRRRSRLVPHPARIRPACN